MFKNLLVILFSNIVFLGAFATEIADIELDESLITVGKLQLGQIKAIDIPFTDMPLSATVLQNIEFRSYAYNRRGDRCVFHTGRLKIVGFSSDKTYVFLEYVSRRLDTIITHIPRPGFCLDGVNILLPITEAIEVFEAPDPESFGTMS